MRIDAHSHGMHAEADASGRLQQPLMTAWRDEYGPPQDWTRRLRSQGIDRLLVVDPPHVAFDLQRIFGDTVIPAPQIDPDKATPEEVEGLFRRGARGIKFIAPMHAYGDNRYFPLYEVIRDHRALAVFHTGFMGMGLFEPGVVLAREDYVDITDMRPATLSRVARAFPDLHILMAHFGNPWWEEAWSILKSHRNIYADFSGGTALVRSMALWKEMFAPNGRLHAATVGKLCFASDDSHFFPNARGYLEVMKFYDRFCEELQVPGELRQRIDRENLLALLAPERPAAAGA